MAQFTEGYARYATLPGVLVIGLLFPPCAFVYAPEITAGFEAIERLLVVNEMGTYNGYWGEPVTTFLGFVVFQIIAYPLFGALIEKYMHGTSSRSRHFRTKGNPPGSIDQVKCDMDRPNMANHAFPPSAVWHHCVDKLQHAMLSLIDDVSGEVIRYADNADEECETKSIHDKVLV